MLEFYSEKKGILKDPINTEWLFVIVTLHVFQVKLLEKS